MKRPLTHLTASAVKAIHTEVRAVHGGSAGIRDEALLESAVAAPQATMMGQPLITDAIEIAAIRQSYSCPVNRIAPLAHVRTSANLNGPLPTLITSTQCQRLA